MSVTVRRAIPEDVPLEDAIANVSAENSSTIPGSPNGCTPIPTAAWSAWTSRPKISQTQISADWAGSSS